MPPKRKSATATRTRRRKPAAKKTRRKPNRNSAFFKPMDVSPALAAIIKTKRAPRTLVVKRLWVYIKRHNLQMASNKRMIKPDAKMAKVFGSQPFSMFAMAKKLNRHLS